MKDDHATPEKDVKRLGLGMLLLAWVLGLGLATLFFDDWLNGQHNPNRQIESRVSDDGMREIVLRQNRNGHYIANGAINGRQVTFLLDTGATDVSVPSGIARELNLERGHPVAMQTANGTITTYASKLDSVKLGDIELSNVRAHVNPHMTGDEVLLGMTFLRKLELTQRDGQLTIRQ